MLPSTLTLPAWVFRSCVSVKSAALSMASATRRLFGAITSRISPPSAIRTGPNTSMSRSRPPLTGPIRSGSAELGTFTIPPLLERAADSTWSGQPFRIIPPVKYCSAVTPSATSERNARYHANKSDAWTPMESNRSSADFGASPVKRNIPRKFDLGPSTAICSATKLPEPAFQRPFTLIFKRGLSARSAKSQRWICRARACTENAQSPGSSATALPLFAVASSANTPRAP